MRLGEKAGLTPASRLLLKATQSGKDESLTPFADNLTWRDAITSLERPSLARRMILARITSQYGDVYFLAIDSSVCRSSLERFTLNGLFLGISRHYSSDAKPIRLCH